jgi:hypothetical protein
VGTHAASGCWAWLVDEAQMKAKIMGVGGFDLIPENDADKALLDSWRFQRAQSCGTLYHDGELVSISICFREEQRANRLKTPGEKA